MNTKTLRQSVLLRATPHEVYEAIMDSKKHAEFTHSPAIIDRKVGGEFSAFDGWASGTTLELIPDKKSSKNGEPPTGLKVIIQR
jgi:uncharacterized protein YndB with AHSA1/START domain